MRAAVGTMMRGSALMHAHGARRAAQVLREHGLTLRQVAKLCRALLGPAAKVSFFTCDKGHSLQDLRTSCQQLLGAQARPAVIVVNAYMGSERKGGLGSVRLPSCYPTTRSSTGVGI